ncbi:hypothetical protein KP77_07480 [Jeotgalibacillus alimentarius]|uniref:YwiC-like protein n=1 Tax=Jeotgalibacillus alimentarius TaxID=135826 RepID=A0A0C2W3P4_9BACL|nr:YwiC-like family protein [Jeotgalibacillus alimentarius]KIL51236.1 hypothetical protein KP77_07480 [Jeotgalibacillus alimentarius]
MFAFNKPSQHGTWAMLTFPPVLGLFYSTFTWQHLFFFTGWLIIFFMSEQLLFWYKRPAKRKEYRNTTILMGFTAGLFFIIPTLYNPGVILLFSAMLPLLLVSLTFVKLKKERHILNDLSGIAIFSLAGMISAYIGSEAYHFSAFILPFLFFSGSAFFVKTMIREKKSTFYRNLSFGYHLLITGLMFLWHPILGAVLLISLGRAIWFWGKSYTPKQIGIFEIANSTIVLIAYIVYVVSVYSI